MPIYGPGGGQSTTVATDTIWDTKGDTVAATGADTAVKVAIGADATVMTADAASTPGLKWAAIPADATKANLASPTFTGTPAAPTAAVDTNTTQLATTAMVLAQAGAATPLASATTAVVGTSTRFARADHVHPTGGLGGPSVFVRRSADSSGKQNNTLASDDTLLFAMGANEVWFVQAWLLVVAVNTTMNSKFGWSLPASATMQWGTNGAGNVAQPGFGAWSSTTPIAILTESGALTVLTFAGSMGVGLAGMIVNSSTPGNATLQWAQSVTNANDLKLKANSILIANRIA